MNWTISEIKRRGRDTVFSGYWKCVLAGFIMMIVTGGFSTVNLNINNFNNYNSSNGLSSITESSGSMNISDLFGVPAAEETMETYNEMISELTSLGPALYILIGTFVVLMFIVLVISFVISAFLLLPLSSGCQKFFAESSRKRSYTISDIAYSFSGQYLNVVKTLFLMDIKIFLWSLLLIIPGVIKSYEYRMIPYIIADDPDIPSAEAFARSRDMMRGNKWHSFLFDLSFIGWIFLSIFTCGLLAIFYVRPYMMASDAELYLVLKGEHPAAGPLPFAPGFGSDQYGNPPYGGQPYQGYNSGAGYGATGNDHPYGDTPYGDTPYGGQPYSNTPYGSSSDSSGDDTSYDSPSDEPSVGSDPSESSYTDGEYREIQVPDEPEDKPYISNNGDTPAFGDKRNDKPNDLPFNTPY